MYVYADGHECIENFVDNYIKKNRIKRVLLIIHISIRVLFPITPGRVSGPLPVCVCLCV